MLFYNIVGLLYVSKCFIKRIVLLKGLNLNTNLVVSISALLQILTTFLTKLSERVYLRCYNSIKLLSFLIKIQQLYSCRFLFNTRLRLTTTQC